MKILLVAPYFYEPHRWTPMAYKSALGLDRIGCEVVVFTSGSKNQPGLERLGQNSKIFRFRDIFIPDPVNYGIMPFLFLRLLKVIRAEKPSHFLVFTHMFHTSQAVILLKLLRKKVVVVTDTFPGIAWFSASRWVNMVLWLYARTAGMAVLKLADRVALLHEGLVETARQIGLRRFVVHPYGVDLHRYESPPPPSDLEKNEGDIIISYVGRLESVKNYPLLFEAARDFIKRYPEVRFVFVGDTSSKTDLVERHQEDRIRFLGHREDVPSILALTDIFVLASFSEGLPSALMEAMASGCACLATRVGGIPYLLGEEEAGLMVPPGDPKAFTESLERLIVDPELRSRLGARARRLIRERYSMDRLSEQTVEHLRTA
jgi:glycosyltransferase involved in cell wall biosynthesis